MLTLAQSFRSKLQADHGHASAPLAAATANRQGDVAPAQIRKFDHRHRACLRLRGSEPFHQDFRGERRDESRGVAARAEGLKSTEGHALELPNPRQAAILHMPPASN